MRCSRCQKSSPPTAVFCIHCGHKFSFAPVAGTIRCLHCRQDSPDAALFCVHCGQSLRRAAAGHVRCAACGERGQWLPYCSRCGQPLPDPAAALCCPDCGQPCADPHAAYCAHCGGALFEQTKQLRVCTGCLRALPAGCLYCAHCGRSLPDAPPISRRCPRCGEDCPQQADYCLRCGEVLSWSSMPASDHAVAPAQGSRPRPTAAPAAQPPAAQPAPATPRCPGCGRECESIALYCARCGQALSAVGAQPPQPGGPAFTRQDPKAAPESQFARTLRAQGRVFAPQDPAKIAKLALDTPQYCPACGEEMPGDDAQCRHCGYTLPAPCAAPSREHRYADAATAPAPAPPCEPAAPLGLSAQQAQLLDEQLDALLTDDAQTAPAASPAPPTVGVTLHPCALPKGKRNRRIHAS